MEIAKKRYARGEISKEEFDKLKANPELIPNMVSEIIRWQTPLAYMRRVAKQDVELNGKTIRKGDKVLMWYASGNRDERSRDSFSAALICIGKRTTVASAPNERKSGNREFVIRLHGEAGKSEGGPPPFDPTTST